MTIRRARADKPLRPAPLKPLRISISREIAGYLDHLASVGLYGETRESVAQELIRRGIIDTITSGILKYR